MFKKLIRSVVAVVVTVVTAGALAPVIGAALSSAVAGSAIAGAIAGAVGSAVSGGDWKKGLLVGAAGGLATELLTGANATAMKAAEGAEQATSGVAEATKSRLAEAAESTPVQQQAAASVAQPAQPAQAGPVLPGEAPSPGMLGEVTTGGPASSGAQSVVSSGPASQEIARMADVGMHAPAAHGATTGGFSGMMKSLENWADKHPWLAKSALKLGEITLGGLASAATPTQAEQAMELAEWQRRNLSDSITGMRPVVSPQQPGRLTYLGGQPVFQGGMLRRI